MVYNIKYLFLFLSLMMYSCDTFKKSASIYEQKSMTCCGKYLPYADGSIESRVSMIKAEILDRMSMDENWIDYKNSNLFYLIVVSTMDDSSIYNYFIRPDSFYTREYFIDEELSFGFLASVDTTKWLMSNCRYIESKGKFDSNKEADLKKIHLYREKEYLYYRYILGGAKYGEYLFAYSGDSYDFYKISQDQDEAGGIESVEFIQTKYIKRTH